VRQDKLTLTDGLAFVSVVGDGLGTPAAVARFSVCANGAAKMLHGTPLRISALVPADQAGMLQNTLHAAFVA
jgi:aspartokinase